MQQQFARAGGVVIGDISVRVRTDMDVEQKRLAILDEAVGILQVGLALADGLDLGAAQRNAGLKFFQQKVVVAGGAIMRGVPLAAGHGVARLRGLFGAGRIFGDNLMAGLARHREASSNLHPSIGGGFTPMVAGLC